MKVVSVHASIDYNILIEHDIIKECGKYISDIIKTRHVAIVTDDIVDRLYGDVVRNSLKEYGFEFFTFVFPNGEKSKCLSVLNDIYDFFASNNITRSDCVIALGGGVVGDITGFAAATFLRGIDYIQIPTTLLAQVDSSVGGKTAIDLPCGKNLVGAFKQPSLVICDPQTLKTLTGKEFSDGMGEVIKYGMIRSRELFDKLGRYDKDTVFSVIDDIIYECVSIKRDVVEADEQDMGIRMILNFGHTIGHAIESYYKYDVYTHGSAVAIGMCIMSEKTADKAITEKLKDCVKRYDLPCSADVSINNLVPLCRNDKKRQSEKINYIVCKEIGRAEIIRTDFNDFAEKFSR